MKTCIEKDSKQSSTRNLRTCALVVWRADLLYSRSQASIFAVQDLHNNPPPRTIPQQQHHHEQPPLPRRKRTIGTTSHEQKQHVFPSTLVHGSNRICPAHRPAIHPSTGNDVHQEHQHPKRAGLPHRKADRHLATATHDGEAARLPGATTDVAAHDEAVCLVRTVLVRAEVPESRHLHPLSIRAGVPKDSGRTAV